MGYSLEQSYKMQLLNAISEQVCNDDTPDREAFIVLHINHCMDNSFVFSEILNRIFPTVVFIGVPYNDRTVDIPHSFCAYYGVRQGEGYRLFLEGEELPVKEQEFLPAVERMIEDALVRLLIPKLREGKRLLILEDGGYHNTVIRRLILQYPELAHQIVASVEQTTSGTRRGMVLGEKEGYLYPQFSIARSDIKMDLESIFIGRRVVEELGALLYAADTFPDFHEVLLLGYGVVGRRIAQELLGKHCHIQVSDISEEILLAAREDGFDTLEDVEGLTFEEDTILIGNTGTSAFLEGMLASFLRGRAKRLYLASSSSQDYEFRVFLEITKRMQRTGEILCGSVLAQVEQTENDTRYIFRTKEGEERTVYLLAGGIPVNFFRKGQISLTDCVIDLIFSEMLLLGLAACRGKIAEPGLYPLGDDERLSDILSEEELLSEWALSYNLQPERLEDLSPHPRKNYLRKLFYGT